MLQPPRTKTTRTSWPRWPWRQCPRPVKPPSLRHYKPKRREPVIDSDMLQMIRKILTERLVCGTQRIVLRFLTPLPNCTSTGGVADLQIHKFLHFVQLAHSCRTRHTKLDHARIFGEKHRIPISPHFTPLDRTDYTNPGDRPLVFTLPSDLRFVAALARHAGRYQYALSLTNRLK